MYLYVSILINICGNISTTRSFQSIRFRCTGKQSNTFKKQNKLSYCCCCCCRRRCCCCLLLLCRFSAAGVLLLLLLLFVAAVCCCCC